MEAETEVLSYEEGGMNDHPHSCRDRKFPNVTLKRGMTDSKALWEWYSNVIDGKIARKNVSIVLYDQQGSEVKRWSFERAYPQNG